MAAGLGLAAVAATDIDRATLAARYPGAEFCENRRARPGDAGSTARQERLCRAS